MDRARRNTRTNRRNVEEVIPAQTRTRKASSPVRKSPVRRSSRPRSTVLGGPAPSTNVVASRTPIKEEEIVKSSPRPRVNLSKLSPQQVSTARGGIKSNLSADTTDRPPKYKSTSVLSSHSTATTTTTTKTIEIRGSPSNLVDVKSTNARRSLSRPLIGDNEREETRTPTNTNTEAESRYSRSVSRSVFDDETNYSRTEYSEDEATIGEEEEDGDYEDNYHSFVGSPQNVGDYKDGRLLCRQVEVPREFGGIWGTAGLLLLIPCLVYYLQWTCRKAGNNNACAFKLPNWNGGVDILNVKYLTEQVFNPFAVASYIAYTFGIILLSVLLPGRGVRLAHLKVEHKFNALTIAIVATILFGIAEYLQYPVADFLLQNYSRFCLYAIINAYIVAAWAYIRTIDRFEVFVAEPSAATQENLYAKSGNFLIDYAQGHQLNPKWFGFLDAKQAFSRVSVITTLLLVEAFIIKTVKIPSHPNSNAGASFIDHAKYYISETSYDTMTTLALALLLIYILDVIVFEHHLASSFELQGEGFGCLLLLRYAVTPFLLTGIAKYFYERPGIELSSIYTAIVAINLLLAGVVLKRLSSATKYKYRIDPYHSYYTSVPTVHTFQGRRLLLGGYWGRLRQPNYAGDILALCALCLPIFLHFSWPPVVGILLMILTLVHRAVRVNVRNQSRYHSSWVRYCQTVRYYIVPKIF